MKKGMVSTGWSLVWRHSKILWWVFFINLILGVSATVTPRIEFGSILDHSLESAKLSNGFDLGAFIELASKPEISSTALLRGSVLFSYLFFLFMLFITGGILTAYREDRKLSTGEFFEASGGFFWRMVRLLLLSVIPLVVVGFVAGIFFAISSQLANEISMFRVRLLGIAVGVILVLLVRLWFDVAQVRAVAQNEHAMFRNVLRSAAITGKALISLLWMYFRISLVAWIVLGLGLWLWTKLPGTQVGLTWVLLEFVLLAQIFARLWQRATSVSWYAHYAEEHPAAAVEFTTPAPAEIAETSSSPEPPPPA